MEVPVELQGYVILGTVIAAIVVGALGYLFKRPESPAATRIQGAAIIDSSIGRDLVEAVERLAASVEAIRILMTNQHERERHAEIERLRIENMDLRSGRRQPP